MARRVFDYRIRRIVDRGNEEDGPDSRARGDRFYHNCRSADRGNEKVDRDPGNISEIKGIWRRVQDHEIQLEIRQIGKRIRELELQREMRKEIESRYVVQDDVNEEEEFDEDKVDIDEGERLFLEQALRWTGSLHGNLLFMPKVQVGFLVEARFTNLNLEGDLIKSPITVGSPINFKWQNKDNTVVAKNAQRKGDKASNGVMEPHANNDTVDFGLYVKNDFFNKISLVDYGPQDQIGRKDYEGLTTTSLDVLNLLSSKIATTKCVGAELFERKPRIMVRQVWRCATPKSPPSSQNASPSLNLRINPQSSSPPSHNPLRDQMTNQLHNISSILESHTQNSSNAYSHAPPSPPSPLIRPPTNDQVEFHSSFCNCCMYTQNHFHFLRNEINFI
nr:hypothetical protein [Tanacetum cinerariifolium]